jgi:hypothetical protein
MTTNIISVFLLSFLINAVAFALSPQFSAFTKDGVLYATVLGDECNRYFGGIEVSPDCRSDRMTKNFALECEANLLVYQTEQACPKSAEVPQSFRIELAPTKIAPEARTLILHYGSQTQRVPIQ